jgi:flagellar hook-associated protein 1 FlgK
VSSTFGSLNIAKSGLQYQQIAMDVANNNIANVNTDGYVRRRAVASEVSAASGTGALWSTYGGHGDGVVAQSVQRLTDVLMDSRVRKEHANLSFLQVQQTSLERVETSIGEPSDTGVASALADFSDSWHDLVTTPDGSAARESVVAAGATLAAAIQNQARAVDDERAEQRAAAVDDVAAINDDAAQLATLNHNIFIAQANGTDVSNLQDQRDQLALDLAQKAGGVVDVDSTGRYNVTVAGVALVTGDKAYAMQVDGINADGTPANGDTANPSAVSFSIIDPDDSSVAPQPLTTGSVGGEIGGIATLLNVTLTNYRNGLNDFAQTLADAVNTQHAAGYDKYGNGGGQFFDYDSSDPAGSLAVLSDVAADPGLVAASSAAGPTNNASNADAITQVLKGTLPDDGTAVNVGDLYQRLITGMGSTVAGLNSQTQNQQLLTTQVDDEREQQAGVSLDEETINLMQAQRAYEASSRVLSVMNSVLDTLINHTGV